MGFLEAKFKLSKVIRSHYLYKLVDMLKVYREFIQKVEGILGENNDMVLNMREKLVEYEDTIRSLENL